MNTLKNFVFRSGIRKITVQAESLEAAKIQLAEIEPDAWTDPTWNWKIEHGAESDAESEPDRIESVFEDDPWEYEIEIDDDLKIESR